MQRNKQTTSRKESTLKKKQITENVNNEILAQMDSNSKNTCFITLKDHKENFLNNPTVRLINPAKNELGRINKAILDNINKRLCTSLNINQWKNTTCVIE